MIVPPTLISIVVAGVTITGWTSYTVTSSLVEPVATFDLVMPFDREAWRRVAREVRCQVRLGDVPVLTGLVGTADCPDGETISINGRNLVGRLVQESAPGVQFTGLSLAQQTAKLAAPWFERVTLSNARNRRILRGKGRQVLAGDEPLRIDPRPGGLVVDPGQMRLAAIEGLARQAQCLVWSSGDGKELIVGRPNHQQEPQWRLFRPAPGSSRTAEATVLSLGVKLSTEERYSRVIVTGAGRGTTANYGAAVASRYGEALDGPGPEGTGGDFVEPKRLVLQQDVRSQAEAVQSARLELARRAARAIVLTAKMPGHGQLCGGAIPTTFCPDTIAWVEDEVTGVRGSFLVVGCTYASSRQEGETTTLELVRRGAELAT